MSFGNLPFFFTNYGPASATNPGFLTGPGVVQQLPANKLWVMPKSNSAAEVLMTWRLDEDTSSFAEILNGTSADGVFIPAFRGTNSGTAIGAIYEGRSTTDTGTSEIVRFDARTVAGAAIVTRPLFAWTNLGTSVLSLIPLNSGANAALSWGTQAVGTPGFTTRSIGARLVLYNALDGSNVDYGFGVGTNFLWASIPQATSTFTFRVYAGNTSVWNVSGAGVMTLGGLCQFKTYTVATAPASPAAGTAAYFTDAGGNGPCLGLGNGSVFKRCDNTSTTVA